MIYQQNLGDRLVDHDRRIDHPCLRGSSWPPCGGPGLYEGPQNHILETLQRHDGGRRWSVLIRPRGVSVSLQISRCVFAGRKRKRWVLRRFISWCLSSEMLKNWCRREENMKHLWFSQQRNKSQIKRKNQRFFFYFLKTFRCKTVTFMAGVFNLF